MSLCYRNVFVLYAKLISVDVCGDVWEDGDGDGGWWWGGDGGGDGGSLPYT